MSNVIATSNFVPVPSTFVPAVDVADDFATFVELYAAGDKLDEIFGTGRKLFWGNSNSLLSEDDGFLKMVAAQKKWAIQYYEVELIEEIKEIRADVEKRADSISERIKAIKELAA